MKSIHTVQTNEMLKIYDDADVTVSVFSVMVEPVTAGSALTGAF